MALTQLKAAGLTADLIDATKLADDSIDSEHIAAGAIDLEHVSSESVDEDNLHISNAGSNGQFLSKQTGDAGGLTWATVSIPASYDDSNLRRDLNTLALQTAVDTNRKAYNLQNSFIDQFEDDTGIGSETDADRDADNEFISSAGLVKTYVAPPMQKISGGQHASSPTTSSWSGGGVTDDRIQATWAVNNSFYPGHAIDYLWDLSQDFVVRIFSNDSSGDILTTTARGISIFITPDTSKAAGASPTDLWDTTLYSAGEAPQISGEGAGVGNGNPGWDDVLNDTYAGSGVTNAVGLSAGDHNSSEHTADSNRTGDANNGRFAISTYHHTGGAAAHSGLEITYTKSNNTLKYEFLSSSSRTTKIANKGATITNVPTSGRMVFTQGYGKDDSRYDASTYNGGSTSDYSWYNAPVTNTTGTVVGVANTASSSRTKVSGTFLYKNASGTATIGTDLKIYFTCNGGTNWTEAASYTAGSDFSTGVKTIYLGETTCTAGTDVRYKAVWANQAAGSKVTEVHGVAINY